MKSDFFKLGVNFYTSSLCIDLHMSQIRFSFGVIVEKPMFSISSMSKSRCKSLSKIRAINADENDCITRGY